MGGDRLDAALAAATGRTASTRAMGKRSTHHQHLVAIEPAPALLAGWLPVIVAPSDEGAATGPGIRARLVPEAAGSDHLELQIADGGGRARLCIGHTSFVDVRGRPTLVIRRVEGASSAVTAWVDLAVAYLLTRGDAAVLHLVTPDPTATALAARLHERGVLASPMAIDGAIIVAAVDRAGLAALVDEATVAAQRAERRPEA